MKDYSSMSPEELEGEACALDLQACDLRRAAEEKRRALVKDGTLFKDGTEVKSILFNGGMQRNGDFIDIEKINIPKRLPVVIQEHECEKCWMESKREGNSIIGCMHVCPEHKGIFEGKVVEL